MRGGGVLGRGWFSKATKRQFLSSKSEMTPKMNYQDYLKTDYWKAVSDAVKKRTDYRCQLCNSQHDLCAHHRTYEHRGRELDHLSDLTCLCRRCHEIFHGKQSVKQRIHVEIKPILERAINGNSVLLTKRLIDQCATDSGGYTSATLNALGVDPTAKGWKKRLLGVSVSCKNYRDALAGRLITGSRREN